MAIPLKPTSESLTTVAKLIREGGVAVIPTETVYGLAANALDEAAVRRVFAIKGRPSDHPLIVHLASASELNGVAEDIPDLAWILAEDFWPGPLTMVLHKSLNIPKLVTGGRETVAVRVPFHSVTIWLLKEAGCPIAAPSANRFTRLSPTRIEDLDPEVLAQVDAALDGGQCDVGVESTVLDLTVEPPVILRPGGISAEAIEAVIGIALGRGVGESNKSPGQHPAHYRPRTPLKIVDHLTPEMPGIVFADASPCQIALGSDPVLFQRELYAALHRLDRGQYERVFIKAPPHEPEWAAVWDRIRRAAQN